MKLKDKRATRGQRIREFTEEEEEQDKLFWSHETWQEVEGDSGSESYEKEDTESDQFSEGFNDTESEEEENSDDEKEASKEAAKQRKVSFYCIFRCGLSNKAPCHQK